MDNKKRILILYASAGEGHRKAALALEEVLKTHDGRFEIYVKDALDFTNAFVRWNYSQGYIILVKYLMKIWGLIYYSLNIKWVYRFISPFRHISNKLTFGKLIKYIEDLEPDCILTTHFMPNELASNLKQKPFTASCITDYKTHWFWITPSVDLYFAATEATKNDLIEKGVSEDKICVSGIPVDVNFWEEIDSLAARKQMNLDPQLFTLLIVGGGFGIGPMEKLAKNLCLSIKENIQIVVVCGHNLKLYKNLTAFIAPENIRLKVLGFTDKVSLLMSASNLIIAKPGGLIMSETFAKKLPCVILSPILGQETFNTEIFLQMGIAKKADNTEQAISIVSELIHSPQSLYELKARMNKLVKPFSAQVIVDKIIANF